MIEAMLPAIDDPFHESPILDLLTTPTVSFLGDLLAHWQAWSKAGGMPHRDRFDPVDFPRLLPDLSLIGIDRHANAYRDYDVLFRSIGTRLGQHFSMTGFTRRHLSDLGAPFAPRWFTVYDRLRHTAQPLTVSGVPYLMNKTYLRFEILLLPLTAGPDERGTAHVDFALYAAHFEPNLAVRHHPS